MRKQDPLAPEPAPTDPRDNSPDEEPSAIDLSTCTIVDLTHPLNERSLYWPGGSAFRFERLSWGPGEDGVWCAFGRFAAPEHLGTHLDAPIHFAPETWTNDRIPVERLVRPAVTVDIRDRARDDPDTVLQEEDLEDWTRRNGPFPRRAILLVRTGWSAHWPDWKAYYGSENPLDTSTLHFPGVAPGAAEAIVAAGFLGVGIDTASIDPGPATDFPAHRLLAAANVFNLENLTGLDVLPERGSWLLALPMKIEGGSGGPVRVLALLP